MLLTILVFVLYFIFFQVALIYMPFVKKSGLTRNTLILLFSIKILAGALYGVFYMQPAYFATSDTWHFFELSKTETDWLLKDPAAFIKDIFSYGYQQSGNLFNGTDSYWNDLKSNLVIKFLAICNVFTGKSYFPDIIFFNFFFILGNIAFYRVVSAIFKLHKWLLITVVFFIPSFMFWCSGIHKDGFIFLCVAMIIFYTYRQWAQQKLQWNYISATIFFFIILFAFRNFMAFLLLPSLVLWTCFLKFPQYANRILLVTAVAGVLIFFATGFGSSPINMPQYVIEKQNEFRQLAGGSQISVPVLSPNPLSFISFFPVAFDIAFFRPHVTEMHNLSYLPASLEVIFAWLIVLASLFVKQKEPASKEQKAFILFCLFFSVSFLILAGYTITFSGAIVRYRAVVLPLLFVPLMARLQVLLNRFFPGLLKHKTFQ